MSGTTYKQGDIVVLPFPYSDLTGAKQRPALVVSNATVNATGDYLLCLVTSQRPVGGVALDRLDSGSLPAPSWVKPHRLFAADGRIIRKRVAIAHQSIQETVLAQISTLLALD